MNKVCLKDIAVSINSGLTPLRSNKEFWEKEEIPWVKTEQLGVKYIYDSNEKISKKALEETSIKLNPKNTLSIAMYGEGKTRGSVSILRNEMTTNQACCNIVIDSQKADFEYVYYFLKTQYKQLRNLSSGVRKNLNSNDIKNFQILVPSIKEQNQVSNFLSSLDSKIELNNRINKELEAMAKLIYDYWFVQFDFPISKEQAVAMGKPELEGKPYKASGGRMVYNEELKREIPEGWEVKTFDDVCDRIQSGGTPLTTNKDYYLGKINWFTTKELDDDYLTSSENSISRQAIKESSAKLFPKDTILIAIYASPTVGRLGILSQESSFNQATCGLIAGPKVSKEYIFQTLLLYRKKLNVLATGTTQKNLGVGTIKKQEIVIPSKPIMTKYNSIVSNSFKKKEIIIEENQKLTELRDWLLPMLMNGQVTIKEAESYVNESELNMAAVKKEGYGE